MSNERLTGCRTRLQAICNGGDPHSVRLTEMPYYSHTARASRRIGLTGGAIVWLLGVIGLAGSASAQYQRPQTNDLAPAQDATLEKARGKANIVEKLGESLPLDATFTDSDGKVVTLGEIFARGKPVIIQMAYYRCPQLCGEVMNGMVASMRGLEGDLEIGEDFEVITISFDSRESAQLAGENKDATVKVMTRSFDEENVRAGWGFWVGDDLNIQRVADAIGFEFGWIPEVQQYSHAAVIVLATPDGRVSRYLYGVTYEPQTLRLSVIEASEGKLQPDLSDAIIYYCFSYDPMTGKYTATAMTVMKIGGVLTVLTLGTVIGFLILAERHGRMRKHPMAGTPMEETNEAPASAFSSPTSKTERLN